MGTLRLTGDIDRDVALLASEQLAALGPEDGPFRVELDEAELEDGAAAAILVEALRLAAVRVGSLEVVGAPQVLAHALYRIGALGPIALTAPREELGRSS